MKRFFILTLIFFCIVMHLSAQNDAIFMRKVEYITADHFWGTDTFDALFFSNASVLTKRWNNQKWEFTDYTLGAISYVSLLNPLKILVFYRNSNTVIILDKYLNEINRIDFNMNSGFANTQFVTPANDNTIWVFNINSQRLELFNIITQKKMVTTQPISDFPVFQYSNFNYCWVMTNKTIYKFNIYGSLVEEIKNDGFQKLQSFNEQLYLFKNHNIYTISEDRTITDKIILPEIRSEQFYVTDEILYIYDLTKLYSFDITPLKK